MDTIFITNGTEKNSKIVKLSSPKSISVKIAKKLEMISYEITNP